MPGFWSIGHDRYHSVMSIADLSQVIGGFTAPAG